MDFGFSAEQDLLRDSAQRFLQAESPTTLAREMVAHDTAHSSTLWVKLAHLGWLGILAPQECGGLGGSFLDLIVLLEEMGKTLLPGPFFATVVLGSTALLGGAPAQRKVWLPKLANGDLIVTVAVAEESGRFDAAGITLPAENQGNGFILRGAKLFVPDAHVADRIIVAARSERATDPHHGITVFNVDARAPGVRVTQLETVDRTRRLCHVVFDDVSVTADDVIGDVHRGWPLLQRVLNHAVAGRSMEMVGTAQRALDLSVEYAKQRVQFGKPIGSFQAVKHACVDMLVQVENARSLCYYAAWAVDRHAPDAYHAVSMAKAYCSDMCKTVCSQAIQVHGGIGFTWEHDLHLYYRRALAGEADFGNATVHRELVAQLLGD